MGLETLDLAKVFESPNPYGLLLAVVGIAIPSYLACMANLKIKKMEADVKKTEIMQEDKENLTKFFSEIKEDSRETRRDILKVYQELADIHKKWGECEASKLLLKIEMERQNQDLQKKFEDQKLQSDAMVEDLKARVSTIETSVPVAPVAGEKSVTKAA